MHVGDYYRNVPVVGGGLGSIVVIGDRLGDPSAWISVVQTFAVAC